MNFWNYFNVRIMTSQKYFQALICNRSLARSFMAGIVVAVRLPGFSPFYGTLKKLMAWQIGVFKKA